MGIKTKEDEKMTYKIYEEVLLPIFGEKLYDYRFSSIIASTHVDGFILKRGEYKDKDKNTIRINTEQFLITFHSNINENGIGDGQEPNIARTYTIKIQIFLSKKRDYRHKEFYESNLGINPMIYSRTIEGLKEKLLKKMEKYSEMMDSLNKI